MAKQMYHMVSKRSKYLILLFLSTTVAVGILLKHFFSPGYYSSLEITYGKTDYPLVTAELQGKSCILAIRFGSRVPLFLSKDTLRAIDKQPQGIAEWHGIGGIKYETQTYLIPKLKIGNLELKNILAYESDAQNYGILGRFLGGEFNLLLDFSHNLIVACDTFPKLQNKKLADKNWVPVPFEIHHGGIVFNVDTDFGTRRLAINTTSTLTHLNSSFLPSEKPFASSSLILGGQQFGNVTFESIELPEGLSEIDGFIGMDFLKEHAVYFDYVHQTAYIEPSKKYFERIPVTLGSRNKPIIDVSIEGTAYPLQLDLGSSVPFSLNENILEKVYKIKYGHSKWYDFKGQQYESPLYSIPEIKIANLTFFHAYANRDNEDFHTNISLEGTPLQLSGMIGLPILEKYNLLLDFPHATIYASNDHLSLQKAGLISKNLLTVPFILHPDGIMLEVETDLKTYRLILDTGSTCTVLRKPHPIFTEKFCVMGHDFGGRSIKTIDLNAQFDFDGTLGMDFLCEYPVFIDYSNKIVFIDLQKGNQPIAID